jgi:hypothetical protein
VDFLLECIGFAPDHDLAELARTARERGEPVAWRGPHGEHYRLPLGGGLDLRIDREDEASPWTLYPHFQSAHRLRMSIEGVCTLPDSPYDALVSGWANPPLDGAPEESPEAYPLSIVLTDRRRLPRGLESGHVLAVSIAGFALDVEFVGNEGGQVEDGKRLLPGGGWIQPLGGVEDPGGCVELSLQNSMTGAEVAMLEVDTPGRPMLLFTSPWQLQCDGLPSPEPGSRVVGTFLLTGRIAGGLASPTKKLGRVFG